MSDYNNFKVIGVRPLNGCNPRILKNLKEDQPYFFYNNYSLLGHEIVDSGQTLPVNFFPSGININAIVGMNGSGKSSVLDIMFRLINNLAYAVLKDEDRPAAEKLTVVKNLNAELYYSKDNYISSIREENGILTWSKGKETSFTFNFNRSDNKDQIICDKKELQDLFYTIVTNYSHYAYNSVEYKHECFTSKSWIDGLFHKNDGYLTPLVFNPFRTNGVIDINSESSLTRSRLTSIFIQQLIIGEDFHEKYKLHSFKISLAKQRTNSKYTYIKSVWDKKKKYSIPTFEMIRDKIIDKWDEIYQFKNSALNFNRNKESYDLALNYLVYKTLKITENYPIYNKEFGIDRFVQAKEWGKQSRLLDNLIQRLNIENSHITLKIRQIMAFLVYSHYQTNNKVIQTEEIIGNVNKLKEFRQDKSVGLDFIMNLLPPPIFNTSFYLSYKNEANRMKRVEMSDLSSGERQFFYSISSILYHLSNLDSINELDRVKYNSVNLVLEEVELYYHPEYQRHYVSNLLQFIKNTKLKYCININITIITHSPFVLSDIPRENILFLEDGIPKNTSELHNTFSANIYDLLNNGFFIKENAIGVFANHKIKKILEDIESCKLNNIEELKSTIETIGEPIIRNYLLNKLRKNAEDKVGRR